MDKKKCSFKSALRKLTLEVGFPCPKILTKYRFFSIKKIDDISFKKKRIFVCVR